MRGGGAYAVPEPVGGGGEANAAGADGEREHLSDNDPGARTPGRRKHGDVDADECNHGGYGSLVGVGALVLTNGHTDDTDDVLGDDHSGSTEDQQVAAADSLYEVEGDGSGAYIDEGGD